MYFKLFLCSNWVIENEYDDSIISFKEDNKKGLCQNNIIKNNNKDMKSIISTSDNNSIYNLEIIEYPYTLSKDDNIDTKNKPYPLPLTKNSYFNHKNNIIEFSNLFHKIKPPNLFVKEDKKNKGSKKPELREDNLIEKKNDNNCLNENENNNDLKESKESSLINNEDSIVNHKDFIENYNSNLNKISNVIKNNEKLNKIINELNVDCPIPDSNNFVLNTDNRPNITCREEKKIFNELLQKIENEKKEINNDDNKNKKPIKTKINLNKLKNINFKNLNLKKISSLGIDVNLQKTYTNFNTDFYKDNIKRSNKDKSKKEILQKIKKIKNKQNIKSFDAPYYNHNKPIFSSKTNCRTPLIHKYSGLKTDEKKNNIYIKKERKKYLSNTFLGDILMKKKNYNYKNTTIAVIDKKKKNMFFKTQKKRSYLALPSFNENPFSTIQKLN